MGRKNERGASCSEGGYVTFFVPCNEWSANKFLVKSRWNPAINNDWSLISRESFLCTRVFDFFSPNVDEHFQTPSQSLYQGQSLIILGRECVVKIGKKKPSVLSCSQFVDHNSNQRFTQKNIHPVKIFLQMINGRPLL